MEEAPSHYRLLLLLLLLLLPLQNMVCLLGRGGERSQQ